jgi:multiple sugar transport system ATP-binding protein
MNFLTGTLEQAEGGLALRHGEGALPLAGLEQDVSRFVGKTVVAGIRPESLSAGTGTAMLSGTVDVVEPTGPDTMVLINVGGQVISARLGSRDRPKLGAPLSVVVDTTAVNLFDPESGQRI